MSRGPFTIAELTTLWRSVVDGNFARRFIEAGEGFGFEAYTQGFAQLVRVSQAVNQIFQSMFILPHSSQTGEPASGAARSLVTLTLERTAFIERGFTFVAGEVVFAEETTDMGENGPIVVRTGRLYTVLESVTIGPGQLGPVELDVIAVRAGNTSNNAQPGNIRRFDQPAAGLGNNGASVRASGPLFGLVAAPQPDVPSHSHVGAYVLFTAGANTGQLRRAIGYIGPNTSEPNGGVLVLASTGQWQAGTFVGVFVMNETVSTPTGEGILRFVDGGRVIIDVTTGAIDTAQTITGLSSGATAVLGFEEQDPELVLEEDAAGWQVLDWEASLGFTVTNEAEPTGGKIGMLDALGAEREVYRSPGEGDEPYRVRVVTPADVVSPNAIIRAANRVLAPLGYAVVLREVGMENFRGAFFDGDPSSTDGNIAFAYDMDFSVQPPDDSLKLALDYTEFRAFMLIGVPRLGDGEFGIAFDDGPNNAYDLPDPFLTFTDGYPVTAAVIYGRIWDAVNKAKAGGVGFDLFQEPPP